MPQVTVPHPRNVKAKLKSLFYQLRHTMTEATSPDKRISNVHCFCCSLPDLPLS
ncbi:hypothetical protein WN55_01279 [Dufourea novaeangliae]|uniref:Uncharacterized protein n=1 Tax=Dufourea novaeangliae TaxID=178035 RepID=A0A154NYB9_DUFNO|nr:hypothetical protein WN55_01279 [Dufourea novaeangliae]